jgi:hypothetical protein
MHCSRFTHHALFLPIWFKRPLGPLKQVLTGSGLRAQGSGFKVQGSRFVSKFLPLESLTVYGRKGQVVVVFKMKDRTSVIKDRVSNIP